MAYYPGSQGGAALADLLFGEASPSGRLPISVPRDVGDLPVRFNYYRHPRPLGPDEHPSSYDPLYEFGHGHSYTDVEYRDVSLVDAPSTLEDTVTVSATVANVGAYDTDERLLLYVTDRTLPVVVPDRELVEFRSVAVEAGESVDVSFELPVRALLPRTDRAVAPATLGPFELSLGEHVVSFDVGE
jgi:beta-glucosidase